MSSKPSDFRSKSGSRQSRPIRHSGGKTGRSEASPQPRSKAPAPGHFAIVVTCPEETKGVLVAELEEYGAKDIVEGYKAVEANVDTETFYRLHLKLRTASRILRVLREFAAADRNMLFDQVRRIPWPEIFDVSRTFMIEGVPADRGEGIPSANQISKAVREALQHTFELKTGVMPVVDLREPKVVLVAWLRKGRCVLSIDTTGKTLHKRGYRLEGHPAPIKETLASAVLRLAGYDGSQVLVEPMCGSGTIAIEAAYVALGKSPQIHRKKGEFGFEWLEDFDRDIWRKVQDDVRGERIAAPPHPIYASDMSPQYVEMSRKNALRARVEKDITFGIGRFQDLPVPELRPTEPGKSQAGLIVANLPYGERLAKDDPKLKNLYVEIGDTLKQKYKGWRAALLAADDSPWKFIGLKPTRKIPLRNGSIPAKLLIFDMYAGSKRMKSDEAARPAE